MTIPEHHHDLLQRFIFNQLAIRGSIASLDTTWQTVLARSDYPPAIRQVLGEALAAAALLHATIKFSGLMTLQLQSDGLLQLLVVQCNDKGQLRGVARYDREVTGAVAFSDLCGRGNLVMAIEPDDRSERYQGVVDLAGHSLSLALERYFERSEQLPTRIHLATSGNKAAGMLLQKLPEDNPDDDGWNRIQHLGATLTDDELLSLSGERIIHRLFHEETVRLFAPKPLQFHCTCSQQRSDNMLTALGFDEIKSILAEQGEVCVTCEFCGMRYTYDAIDSAQLFAPVHPASSSTRH